MNQSHSTTTRGVLCHSQGYSLISREVLKTKEIEEEEGRERPRTRFSDQTHLGGGLVDSYIELIFVLQQVSSEFDQQRS